MPTFRTISFRRAAPAALAAAMLISIFPAATMASNQAPPQIRAAEWKVLSHMNQVRQRHGLAPLRMAGGVRIVARDRSRSMKNANYFSHTAPSGATAGSMLRSRNIRHAFWGEAIGWTNSMDLTTGARWMVDWWKQSTTHRRLMLRRDFNYAGVGIARDGNTTLWTIVFVNQPDHTPPQASLAGPASRFVAAANTKVGVSWWGKDRRLSTRTAGLKGFTLQRKRAGSGWRTVKRNTSQRSVDIQLPSGTHYFRLRAVDRRGNRGGWQPPLKVVVS
jgi:uncharacterized protein YkwD